MGRAQIGAWGHAEQAGQGGGEESPDLAGFVWLTRQLIHRSNQNVNFATFM